jgi:hypothetical protein
MSTTPKNTKPAKAEAAKPLVLPEQTAAGAVRSAVMAATTYAEHLAAAGKAATFVAEVGAAAWSATLMGRRSIGESMFGAHVVKVTTADAEAAKPAAADVTFTALMASLYGVDKSGYEALARDKRQGPGHRSWSALAEDYACFVNTADDIWHDAYRLSIGDDVPTIRGYTTFARQAAAEQTAATERGETPQMAGARTKAAKAAAAKAEAERQTAARKAAADKRVADAEAAAEAATNRATAILRHVSEHPSANLVTGVSLSCADAAALSVTTLRALAEAATIIADEAERVAAEAAKAAKAAKPQPVVVADVVAAGQTAAAAAMAAQPDTEAEVAAIGEQAEAAAAADPLAALAEQVASITAALAAMAANK